MVSRHIFNNYKLDEGKMSLLRASLIKRDTLVTYTKHLELDKCLIIGKGGNKLLNNSGILADIFESFIAAVYLDLGYVQVEKILKKTIYKDIKKT
jgi:ribonuclease-3